MSQDETIWGHIATEERIDNPIRKITGTVLDAGGFPLNGALVELFVDDGIHRTPTTPKTKRKAGCKTSDNGRFCFDELKPGKYILAVGQVGFNISFISFVLSPKNPQSSKESLSIQLHIGT